MKCNRSIFYLLLFVGLFLPFSGWAQFNVFRNFDVKDGLPSSEVYKVMQDSRGYLWFVTDMGVSRYNGYEFKNFSTEHGLPDNTVFNMCEDSKHNIWFASFNGLCYIQNDSVHRIPGNEQLKKITAGLVATSMYVDEHDTIWIGLSASHIIRVAPGHRGEDVQKIQLTNAEFYIYEFGNGHFLYGGYFNPVINVFKNGKLSYKIDAHLPASKPLDFHMRSAACRKQNGDYIVTISNWMLGISEQKMSWKVWLPFQVTRMAENIDSTVLAGSFSGVYIVGKGFIQHTDSSIYKSFSDIAVTDVCLDRENELWVSTKGQGVFYVPFQNFKYYTIEDGLPSSSISCIGKVGKQVMTGHLSGEVCVLEKDNIQPYRLPKRNLLNSISQENVTSILSVNDKIAYISRGDAVFKLDSKTKIVSKNMLGAISKKLIAARGSEGKLFSLRYRKLSEIDSNLKEVIVDSAYVPAYADNLYEDKNGLIWICSSNGLYTYDPKKKGFYFEGGDKQPLFSSRIVDLGERPDRSFWMVSRGEGVIIRNNGAFFQIRAKDGLSSNMCRSLLIDTGNTVWVGTNNGLNKISVQSYKPFKFKVETFYSTNGLLTNDVNYMIRHENRIYIAHNKGVSVFDPRFIKNNKQPPPIYLTRILINNEMPNGKDWDHLKYTENYLTIHFHGLSYKVPGAIVYKYKLEGLDNSWNYGANTFVKYQTLPPGTYRFVVYAINSDGYESTHPATLSFVIIPPWWQTWVFRVAMVVVLLVIIGIVFKYRLNIIERRERLKTIQQTRMAAAELKALRAQMNPHFVFNAINSVQYFITSNDPVSSQKYLAKFAKLIRYVVDNSKPQVIPLKNELNALQLYLDLECLRFGDKIDYNIVVDEELDASIVEIPSMLIQPYVENAIWHGLMPKEGKGYINICLYLRDDVLLCVVEDNGIGRKKSRQLKAGQQQVSHKSIGMSVTQERLEIINSLHKRNLSVEIIDREDDDGKSLGTRVELYIPLN